MRTYTSYNIRIRDYHHIFDDTIKVYRKAVGFLIDVSIKHWNEIEALSDLKARQRHVEMLIHSTRKNAARYDFDDAFYKFPSFLRRAAISAAIGKVSAYKSNLNNWSKKPSGSIPRKPTAGSIFPVLYRGNCIRNRGDDKYKCEIKAYIRNTWDWVSVELRKSDVDYIERHCDGREGKSPSLIRKGKRWVLAFPFVSTVKLPESVETIVAVDLGVNSACVCTAMKSDGTILGRHFLRFSKEQDCLTHALNHIKQAHQRGNHKTPRLWSKAKYINCDIAEKTASYIVNVAERYNAECIVLEHLNLRKKKFGHTKQKLHHWKARSVQRIVANKAHGAGIRIAHVYAAGTSSLAFDGSGPVRRDRKNCSLCVFPSGKRYNTDLSASYNIGARYFIRETMKSLPETARLDFEAKVPQIAKRSTCTYSTFLKMRDLLQQAA